ncbi:polysaccharide biosynthesis/export family protein [candidate division CSSED10-310 bacterium]|uniref:Polysaccharide biosynthesis/export family protein n=1 Tax=candidate division CSSED10-310 bacterium TaxID=2855610 RepID=A0ABV6YSF2_UNCC1
MTQALNIWLAVVIPLITQTSMDIQSISLVENNQEWYISLLYRGSDIQYLQGRLHNPERIFYDFKNATKGISWEKRELGRDTLVRIRLYPLAHRKEKIIRLSFDVTIGTTCQITEPSPGEIQFRFVNTVLKTASETVDPSQIIKEGHPDNFDRTERIQTETGMASDITPGNKPETGADDEGLRREQPPTFPFRTAESDLNSDDVRYRIGPDDSLSISVFDVPSLNQEVHVDEDGSINFPPIGFIGARNHTTRSLAKKIATLLEKYVKNPKVNVSITQFRSQRVLVIGAVGKAGDYVLRGQRTLLQIMIQAGGVSAQAGKKVEIIRKDSASGYNRMSFNIEDIMTKFNPMLDIRLQPNDIVFVPPEETVFIYYIIGALRRVGIAQFKKSEPLTLFRLIAQLGGTSENAALKRLRVLRLKEDGQRETIKVNLKAILKGKALDFTLEPSDIVYIPDKYF